MPHGDVTEVGSLAVARHPPLARDTWSKVIRLRQATNEYALLSPSELGFDILHCILSQLDLLSKRLGVDRSTNSK